MSADLLREAAALMRERARAATPGPWEKTTEGATNGVAWISTPAAGHAFSMHGWPDDAAHIESWDPEVAKAVADLLDRAANDHDETPCPAVDAALAVARAYLGERPVTTTPPTSPKVVPGTTASAGDPGRTPAEAPPAPRERQAVRYWPTAKAYAALDGECR